MGTLVRIFAIRIRLRSLILTLLTFGLHLDDRNRMQFCKRSTCITPTLDARLTPALAAALLTGHSSRISSLVLNACIGIRRCYD